MSSFGEELRRERELREISLREVSEATKISFRHLEALEANEFGELPGGVFNRGFVRAYSQYIGIDPEAMVTSYLMEEQARQTDAAKKDDGHVLRRSDPFSTQRTNALADLSSAQLRWGFAAVIAIVLLVGGFLLWSWLAPDDDEATSTAEPVENGFVVPGPEAGTRTARQPPAITKPDRTETPPDKPDAEPAAEPDEAEDERPVTHAGGFVAPPTTAKPEAAPREEAVEELVTPDGVRTRIRIVRATTGRINCDNTRIEMLAGVRAGTTVEFLCKRFLLIDATDAGAVELELGNRPARSLGPDGQRLADHRIDLTRLAPEEDSP